ncbi:MAG TPA: hypothetical protein VJ842_19720 [Pyrinomonadaceae bacterium]|nr:hypothetical protein [Pyrinomonadaceae bacterium]
MATKEGRVKEGGGRGDEGRRARRVNKKDQILALFMSGIGEVEDLAMITGSRPSYVGSILQEAGLKPGYFDLYTSTSHSMNVYSKFFAGKLGFKDEETARASLELIDRLYRQFEFAGDRAGQHHAMAMALTMYNRARWTGKGAEADIFREWMLARLQEVETGDDVVEASADVVEASADGEESDALPSLD